MARCIVPGCDRRADPKPNARGLCRPHFIELVAFTKQKGRCTFCQRRDLPLTAVNLVATSDMHTRIDGAVEGAELCSECFGTIRTLPPHLFMTVPPGDKN